MLITRANSCKSSSAAVWPVWQTMGTGGNLPVFAGISPFHLRDTSRWKKKKKNNLPAFALLRVTGEEERHLKQKINIFVLFRVVPSSRYVLVHLCIWLTCQFYRSLHLIQTGSRLVLLVQEAALSLLRHYPQPISSSVFLVKLYSWNPLLVVLFDVTFFFFNCLLLTKQQVIRKESQLLSEL